MWDWIAGRPDKAEAKFNPIALPEYESIVGVYYKCAIAADAVCTMQNSVRSLAQFINMNSAHGYFEESMSLKKDLESMKDHLRMWRARYNSAGLNLIE